MINYNKMVNGIPMFKVSKNSGDCVDVVSGKFLEKYFDKMNGDTKIKTVIRANSIYKENEDFFVNYNLDVYKNLNLFSHVRDDSYDVLFTKSGVEKYINNTRNNKAPIVVLKNKQLHKAFDEISKTEYKPIELFDIITDGSFGIDFVVDLVNYFLKDFSSYNLYEIINGKFEIKSKISYENVNGTSVPHMIPYIKKDALEYVLMELFRKNMLTKDQMLFLVRKVLQKQMSMENCA